MTEPGMYMSYGLRMSEEEAAKPPVREADQWKGSGGTGRFPQREAAKPPVREADQWKGSGGTGRFPQREAAREQAPQVEREERRLARLRLVTIPPQDAWETDDEPPPQ